MSKPFAALLVLAAACSQQAHTPTYSEDVQPILEARCNGCHNAEGIAPFSLDTYARAASRADSILDTVVDRHMPPWPPSQDGLPLKGVRRLDDREVQIISDWVKADAPRGPADAKPTPIPSDLPTVRNDKLVSMAEPYAPKLGYTDDYRCFVIDPQMTKAKLATGYDVHAGMPSQVHHVIVFEVMNEQDAVAQLQALDDADPGPGYECFGGPGVNLDAGPSGLPPVRFVGGWAPGQGATRMPAHTGIRIESGARLVIQVHYNEINGRLPDQTSVGLELEDPRPDLEEGLLVPILDDRFKIPAGAKSYTHGDSFLIPSYIPAFDVHGVYPHMHLLGKSIQLTVDSPGKPSSMLLGIDDWHFHWQGSYELQTPVHVKPGDTLGVKCTWDNSPENQPLLAGVRAAPREVRWGERTTDEMCLGFLYVTF